MIQDPDGSSHMHLPSKQQREWTQWRKKWFDSHFVSHHHGASPKYVLLHEQWWLQWGSCTCSHSEPQAGHTSSHDTCHSQKPHPPHCQQSHVRWLVWYLYKRANSQRNQYRPEEKGCVKGRPVFVTGKIMPKFCLDSQYAAVSGVHYSLPIIPHDHLNNGYSDAKCPEVLGEHHTSWSRSVRNPYQISTIDQIDSTDDGSIHISLLLDVLIKKRNYSFIIHGRCAPFITSLLSAYTANSIMKDTSSASVPLWLNFWW